MLITDPGRTFGDLRPKGYNDELLTHAHDLANRMLDSFEVRCSNESFWVLPVFRQL